MMHFFIFNIYLYFNLNFQCQCRCYSYRHCIKFEYRTRWNKRNSHV